MPSQSGKGKGKGKAKRKGRGRKTTDWLFAPGTEIGANIHLQTTDPVDASLSKRIQTVSVTGGAANETFTLTLGTETTGPIMHNAKKNEVRKEIKDKFKTVTSVACTGGPLGQNNPVTIDFKETNLTTVPKLSFDKTGLGNNGDVVVETPQSGEIAWKWTDAVTWRDADSGREIMGVSGDDNNGVGGMQLTADTKGLWRLAYSRQLYVFNHKWVYKLNAYSANNELLLRLTVPVSGGVNVLKFGSSAHPIVEYGNSVALADVLQEIDSWIRVGVGEYWD